MIKANALDQYHWWIPSLEIQDLFDLFWKLKANVVDSHLYTMDTLSTADMCF